MKMNRTIKNILLTIVALMEILFRKTIGRIYALLSSRREVIVV